MRPAAWLARPPELPPRTPSAILVVLPESEMSWMIGRTAALADPEAARRKALAKLQGLAELDDPESLVVPILIESLLMVESYRGARHQISFLPELTNSIDALLRELTIVEKSKEWAGG